jgi:hypothetical protein
VSRLWQRYNTPLPFPPLVLADDAPPPTVRPTVPRDRFARHHDRTAAPGVINPPGGRVRRNGSGAEWTAGPREQAPLDALHAQLGTWLDDDGPELESAPAATQLDPDSLHSITVLAKALHRRTHTIRDWERRGVIPHAATRTEGVAHQGGLATTTTTSARRLYTGAEIEAAAQIAADEGLLLGRGQHVDISSSEFTERVSAAWQRLRAENR